MEWTITLHAEEQYAEIVTRGIADRESSLAMAKAIHDALGKTGITNILIDHLNIDRVSGAIVDAYARPLELEIIGVSARIRIAEIVRQEHTAFFKFLETVCVNRGFQFLVFEDRESAMGWLSGP